MEKEPRIAETLSVLGKYKRNPSLANLKDIIPFTTHAFNKVKQSAIDAATVTIKTALFDSYHDINEDIRKSLVDLMAKIRPDIISTLRNEIYSPDIFKRVRSIQILGLISKKGEVREYLKEMIRDSDEKVRATVIRSLGEMIEKSEANILITLLNDFDDRVRANTIEALEHVGNQNLVGIIARYRNDSHNRIRANAIKALWKLGYKDFKGPFEEMIRSQDENMCASGVWLIGEIGKSDSSFIHYIKEIKYTNSKFIRNNVIRALVKIDSSDSRLYLTSLFDKSEIDEVKEIYNIP